MDAYTETFAVPPLRALPAVSLRVEYTLGDASDLVEVEWGEHIPTAETLIAIGTALARRNLTEP